MKRILLLVSFALAACTLSYSEDSPKILLEKPSVKDYDLEFRVWRDKTGNFEVVAKFHDFIEDKVRLRREDSGDLIAVAIETLSVNDQELLKVIRESLKARVLTNRQKRTLDHFKFGFEKFLNASIGKIESKNKLISDTASTAIEKKELSRQIFSSFREILDGQKLRWHVSVVDVTRGNARSVSIQVIDTFDGAISSNITAVNLNMKERLWRQIEKGDVLRVDVVVDLDYSRRTRYFLTLSFPASYVKSQPSLTRMYEKLPISVRNVRRLTEVENEVVPEAKDWFKSIGKKFFTTEDEAEQESAGASP